MANLSIKVLNIKTGEWIPYHAELKCYYLQQHNNSLMEFYPTSVFDDFCGIRGGSIPEYSATRIKWHNTSYEMTVRGSGPFRKPGQRRIRSNVLCVNHPDSYFGNFGPGSFTAQDGKIFYIRWGIAGKGDIWVTHSTTHEGYIIIGDAGEHRAAGMLITGGEMWLGGTTKIPKVVFDHVGKAHIVNGE
ncbi:hypothetical protein DFQ28_010352 [Apophysomyces sp. BC1034]|nr:hypothetical protein DFQ30_010022 [Apophysomyces sp. BC1015]KAG0171337.1 hypothetical protein DFQ29_008894 [Apophysomyces sp. BC1021]KAG0184851.1 hypothetical protein DFQ28_010352 [Apophysomyces sp. BC1034]